MQRFCIRRDVCTLAYPSLHYLGTFPELIRLGGFRVIAVCRQSRSSTQWHTLLHSKRHLLDTSSLPAFRPGAPKGPVDWRSATAVSIPSTRACSSFKKHSSSKLWRPWCCKRWTRHSRRLAACHEWKGQTDYYARALSGTWTDTSSHRSASQSREDYHVTLGDQFFGFPVHSAFEAPSVADLLPEAPSLFYCRVPNSKHLFLDRMGYNFAVAAQPYEVLHTTVLPVFPDIP